MIKYILQRLGLMLLTLFIIVSIGFFVIRLMPGSPFDDPDYSPELVQMLEEKAHLHEPIAVQYYYFLRDLVLKGDWGISLKIAPSQPVFQVLKDRIPYSMALHVSILISIPLGMIAGTIAALHKAKLVDHVVSFLVIICISVPSFVFASLLQYLLAFKGGMPIIFNATGTTGEKWYSLILPILALSFSPIATITRYLRGELIETMSSEYLLLAKTKGLSRAKAIVRHAFRNSLVPLAPVIIPMFTHIMSGSLVIERIFSIPGVGGIMTKSINAYDHWLTIAILIFYSVINLATILIVDISYALIDPRIRLGGDKNG